MLRLARSPLSRRAVATFRSPSSFVPFVASTCRRSLSSSGGTWNWNKFAHGNGTDGDGSADKKNESQEAQVLKNCGELYMSLMPLNEKLRGPLEQQQLTADGGVEGTLIGNNTLLPFVFLVGNHSSGKSSFINYVMGRNVQTAGVAPTDDCFTIITAGPEDQDQDGPAFIYGNPAFGFNSLSQFGPTLIHHTQLKVRKDIRTTEFMMVDSPGMIDSPASMGGMLQQGNPKDSSASLMDRGYDFPGVVRWFAERADIVLLFFDPDKPGTTGETLSILLHSLGGMDHKLMIVLNKADQFEKIHDFALEDAMEKLNNTTTTSNGEEDMEGDQSAQTATAPASAVQGGLSDLYATKDEVVAEVMKAPKRRVDNVITHLYDSVCVLRMHTRVCQDLRQRYNRHYWDCKYQELGLTAGSAGLTGAIWYAGNAGPLAAAASSGAWSMEAVLGSVVAASILGIGGLTWYNGAKLRAHEKELMSVEGLSTSFQNCHRREIREGDEYVASLWQRIREPLQSSLEQMGGLSRMPSSPSINYDNEVKRLSEILERDIPSLRRIVSPTTSASSR
ncbi:EH domain-containing protein 2 [Seminavis robusta]|uniref:EH domain-containing protein 2 n=1 Tax=Seminavis robusta TaxID=568900 RepID=A0A9N8H5B1_9STRA|nr:EH domain-containing protein 2 [Seminavis robusta]|eukprot:Sro70_g038840.1 EH domain-containing protein 2 (561) ;mRNA; r:47032-49120